MAYDEDLAARIRALIGDEEGLTEKKMFGGLAFLINGNMSVSASGQGGLLLRVDPEQSDALLDEPGAEPFVMRGRAMDGWMRIAPEAVQDDDEALRRWVRVGVEYARTLAPKR
jgi:TfoX/Sxy family transcriptional regulator of competence genes